MIALPAGLPTAASEPSIPVRITPFGRPPGEGAGGSSAPGAWGTAAGGHDARPTPVPLDSDLGDALSLVDKASLRPTPRVPPPDPRRELDDRFALGDFSGALLLAGVLLGETPHDAEVQRVAAECRARLEEMYGSRLGALDRVPVAIVPRADLKWLSLDHRAGFLLSLVDGESSIEEILDVAGMPALEVLRTLYTLVAQRVIEIRPPGRG
jgi:hypothetical protein